MDFIRLRDISSVNQVSGPPSLTHISDPQVIGRATVDELLEIGELLEDGVSISPSQVESIFQNLKAGLENNSTTQGLVKRLEKEAADFVSVCRSEPGFDWKEEVRKGPSGRMSEEWTKHRDEAYKTVCEITAEILGQKDVRFINIGSQGIKSDADITISYESPENKTIADHAECLGTFAAVAGIVWTAVLGKTSLQQADTEFYPPHIAQYFKGFDESGKIPESVDACRVFSMLSHSKKTCSEEEYTRTLKVLSSLQDRDEVDAGLGRIVEYIETQDEEDKAAQSLLGLYGSLFNNIKVIQFSRKMGEVAREAQQCLSSDEKNEKFSEFLFLSILRARFLPEAYFGEAMKVICLDRGGQAHTSELKKWNEWFKSQETSFRDVCEMLSDDQAYYSRGSMLGFIDHIHWNQSNSNHDRYLALLKDAVISAYVEARHERTEDKWPVVREKLKDTFTDPSSVLESSFAQSQRKELIESVVENGNFALHRLAHGESSERVPDSLAIELKREAVIDSSKYFTRIYGNMVDLIKGVIKEHPDVIQLNKILVDFDKKKTLWQNLESEKRDRFSSEAILGTIESLPQVPNLSLDEGQRLRKAVRRSFTGISKQANSDEILEAKRDAERGLRLQEFTGRRTNELFYETLHELSKKFIEERPEIHQEHSTIVEHSIEDLSNGEINLESLRRSYFKDLHQMLALFRSDIAMNRNQVKTLLDSEQNTSIQSR